MTRALGRPPRVAVVGVRRVRTGLGQFLAKHLVRHGAEVAAFIGTRPGTVAEGRELLAGIGIHARGFTSLPELLAQEPVDALVVASPHATHLEWLERARDADLHCLCEKPLVWEVEDAPDRAGELVRDFRSRRRVLHENCPWPFTLAAFDALHPAARTGGVRDFAMWLSPSQPGAGMLADCMSHPISLLQALTDADASHVEEVRFSTRSPSALQVEVAFTFAAGAQRVASMVRLAVVAEQPRPAGFTVNGRAADRRVRMSDYGLSFADGGRWVPVDDPMDALVGRFVASVVSGEPEAESRRQGRRIVDRLRIVDGIVRDFLRP